MLKLRHRLAVIAITSLILFLLCYHGNYMFIPYQYFKITADCNTNLISPSSIGKTKQDGKKVIYGATCSFYRWENMFSFQGCDYNNCIVQSCTAFDNMEHADVVLFLYTRMVWIPALPWQQRQNQIWLLIQHESPAYSRNRLKNYWVNNIFNGTVTYRHDSDIYFPYSGSRRKKHEELHLNLSTKTKGAFAYVSNCNSQHYSRIELMKSLSKYIEVDIYGECTGVVPCAQFNYTCSDLLHSKYRFYLSFENSLCQDYITEKFWTNLASPSLYVPVVVGGTSLKEYQRVAPPDSFIHLYNFSSVEHLGKYLQLLMTDDDAYSAYHRWRQTYEISGDAPNTSCKICELANKKPFMPVKQDLDDWWNPKCRTLTDILPHFKA